MPAMKKVAGGLRLDLAAFRELEAFAQLGTELDPATQSRLDRGYRMTELLKQGLYQPMHVTDQVLSIYAGTRGHLDKVRSSEVHDWESEFLKYMHEQKPACGRRSPTARNSRPTRGGNWNRPSKNSRGRLPKEEKMSRLIMFQPAHVIGASAA